MRRIMKCRALSVLMAVCLIFGVLPADLLGGIARVQAAEASEAWDFLASRDCDNSMTEYGTSDITIDAEGKSSGDCEITYIAGGDKWKYRNVPAQMPDGSILDGLYQAGGASKISNGIPSSRAFQITLKKSAKLEIYTGNSSSSGECRVFLTDGVTPVLLASYSDIRYDGFVETEALEPGSYYLYCENKGFFVGGIQAVFTDSDASDGNQGGENDDAGQTVSVNDVYDFRDGSIIPAQTSLNGNTPVTSEDGKLTVDSGAQNGYGYNGSQHGAVFKPGNTVTISVEGNADISVAGCQYSNSSSIVSLSVNGAALESKATQTAGCYHNDPANSILLSYRGEAAQLVLTFDGGTTYVPFISVTREEKKDPAPSVTTVNAEVTVSDEAGLLNGGGVTLVNEADPSDACVVNASGASLTLKANAVYRAVVADSDLKATLNGRDTVATSTEDLNISIVIESIVAKPVITISDPENVLGEATLTLTNMEAEEESHVLVDGEAVKLKIGAVYLLSCSDAAVTAVIAGGKTVAIAGGESSLVVDVTKADVTHHELDVWDFGAQQLESTALVTYHNKLTKDIINGWYPAEVTPGSKGNTIPGDLLVKDENGNTEIVFHTGGFNNTHRYRTVNQELTRYDEKSLKDTEDSSIIYQGYIYSNKGSTDAVNLQIALEAGDIVTFVASSNGSESDLTFVSPSGKKEAQTFSGKSSQGKRMIFHAGETGMYTLYSANEKLVVARVMRERPGKVNVSGKVTMPAGAELDKAELVFTNDITGEVSKASVTGGRYSVALSEQYTYTISLEGANGYIVGSQDSLKLDNEAGDTKLDVEIIAVALAKVTGSLEGITQADAAKLTLEFSSDRIYKPECRVDAQALTYEVSLEKGVAYQVKEAGVNDYTLETAVMTVDADSAQPVVFARKPVYNIKVALQGPSPEQAQGAVLTFTNIREEEYVYTFTGTNGIALRDGQYRVSVKLDGFVQQVTSDVKVNGAAVDKTIVLKKQQESVVPYTPELAVGASSQYQTVNEALEAVRRMERTGDQRVTIVIEPGNYEEMLVIDAENVTLRNASASPSLELKDQGVSIGENAVRITSYYGHGYTYYSMGEDCKYSEELLAANKENGYPSFENPGSGTSMGSYWNATVVVNASGFEADGIIFENSFNQYVSPRAAEDILVKQDGAKEGSVPRAGMKAGDTTVQNKAYVERAAALAIDNNLNGILLNNCKLVGRQDTLYGGKGTFAEFRDCSVYGGTDYIFGGMTALFQNCELVFNTSDDKNDAGYITAAQQTSGRGYLMLDCHVTSTVPGVDTASQYPSKPGYFGRPWAAGTSEVVFFNTTVDAADEHWVNADGSDSKTNGPSLIAAAGWDSSLSGESAGMYEYGTVEKSGVDQSASRAGWATLLKEARLNDGTLISPDAFRYTAPVKDLYQLKLADGLKKGVTYDGGFSVLEDMAYKTVTGDTISGTVYTGYVAGSSNPKTGDASAAGTVPDSGSVIKLTAVRDGKLRVAVKINAGKTVYLVDETEGGFAQEYKNEGAASEFTVMSYEVLAGHTYYFYGNGTKAPVYSAVVDYRESVDWNEVAAPALGAPAVKGGTIEVPFTAQVGGLYSDSLEVKMMLAGEVADTQSVSGECAEGVISFAPTASGTYTFRATLKRSGEVGKSGSESSPVDFLLPMAQPVIINAENLGGGKVRFSWKEVPEAEGYQVYLDGQLAETVREPLYRFTGLTIGQEYTFGVEAVRGEDVSSRASVVQTVTGEGQKTWAYAAFGSGVDTKNNGFSGSAQGNDLALWSKNAKGKLVPASTDGLAFYYTTIDPLTENFRLSADVTVDSWTYSNGQEGFGLMAADAVGENGDSSIFWNNSYMAAVTKVEYYWNQASGAVSDSGAKYTMKLGVGSQEKIGATRENITQGTTVKDFSSKMTTLETSCPALGKGEGTYNIAGNYTNQDVDMGDVKSVTTFHLTIERNNTGYFVSYTDEEGNTITKKYYHGDDGDELTRVDENNIYVGFFASRNASIQVKNVELTTVEPGDDQPAETRPTELVTPSYSIESAKVSNTEEYKLVYYGNADGTLNITGPEGEVVRDLRVEANTKYGLDTYLRSGENTFRITMKPDEDYQPSKYERLSSYEAKSFSFTVTCHKYKGDIVYVSPDGKAEAAGTREAPMDIYSAVKYAVPGQKILLAGGTYQLTSTLTVERGIDGTRLSPITMMADPEAAQRPVLNFGGKCAGMVIAGDNWYFQGFDVTRSANGQKGIQVSGSNNTLDGLRAYRNGNTGIQISRYKSSDAKEDWPSDNLILNCTSYLNADAGYEDADGFAAKLTVGDGNVFDGCIAAYNADDGWDLFAKVETGPIGMVVLQNCVAFKNGYWINEAGKEVNAGNGNGFKMGGSSITGKHTLINSISFANKAKGIDSNSCPDIQVYNSTSYNNESYNVAFYTNDTKNTDFYAQGVLSYKDGNKEPEQIKLKGSQDENKIYRSDNYYFNGAYSQNMKKVRASSDWFVSLDTEKAIHGGISRNADGSINMNGYLELTAKAPADAGARISGAGQSSGSIQTKDRDTLTALAEALALLQDASGVNKEELARKAIGEVERLRLDDMTIESAEEIGYLQQIEELLKTLLGGELKIETKSGAIPVTNIQGALFSLPLAEDGTLVVSRVTQEELALSQDQIQTYMPGRKVLSEAFDLTLLGTQRSYQLKAPVWFTFTIPENMKQAKDFILLHIKDDGEVEKLSLRREGDQLSALTGSFSTFVLLAENGEESSNNGQNPAPDTNPDDTPGGGQGDADDTPGGGQGDADDTPDSGQKDTDDTSGQDNAGKDGNDQKSSNTSVRKSPATYDNSVFLPGNQGGSAVKPDSESTDTKAAKGILAAAETPGANNSFSWPMIVLILAVLCVAGAAAGLRIYRGKKEEEQ